jgi:hypothetical protein
LIFVAGSFEFDRGLSFRAERQLITETFFTDPNTATYLAGVKSAIAAAYPRSAVRGKTNVVDSVSVSEAIDAAISEPVLFKPACVSGSQYAGSIVDVWPIEVANRLAHETVVPKFHPFGRLTNMALSAIVEYNENHRMQSVDQMPVAYRIDSSDFNSTMSKNSFWFRPKLVHDQSEIQSDAPGEGNKIRPYLMPRFRIVDGIPSNLCEFQRRLNAQWQYGYERGAAAFRCESDK